MIIDVIDLNLKSVRFARKYDNNRHRKAAQIFRRGSVSIQEVDKLDENNYSIKAYVDGNYYDTYNTTITISNDVITEGTCTCMDYENGNLCKHIIATAMETLNPHYASTEEGEKRLELKREEEREKRAEELKRRQEEERKRIEYENKYRDGLDMINLYKRNNTSQIVLDNFDILDLYDRSQLAKKNETSELATDIKIEFVVGIYDEKTLEITFKIGQSRMYVLNNISNLYNAYKNGTEIYYGKQLRFIPRRENFSDDSKWLFDYIMQYAEMMEYYDSFNRYSGTTILDKQILIKGNKIDEFLSLIPDKKLLFHCYNYNGAKGNELCTLTEENLEISYTITREKVRTYSYYYWDNEHEKISDEYVLKLNISNYLVFFSDKKIYIFYMNKIYKKEKNENLMNLFHMLRHDDHVLIPEDKIEEFTKFVMPKINIKANNLPAEFVKEGGIADVLASKILLDIDPQGNIMLELKFCYQDYEFNILEKDYLKYVEQNKIVRDIPAETEVVKRIFTDGFEPSFDKKYFVMKNTDDIYEFLSKKIEDYMNDFEVLATEKFKNKQIRQPKISNIGIKVDNGLLELDISKINIDISEIKNILKDYNIKKKYYKLKSGDFLDLTNNEDLNLLDELETTLDIDYSKIDKGIVNLPISRSFYLERLTNTKEGIHITKNEKYTELIDSIQNPSMNIGLDKDLEEKLRDYQKVGYKWLKTLATYQFGGILADDMGLGKTIQIIALLKSEIDKNDKNTSIVVCPSTLVLNWKAEIERWCNSIKVLIVKGTAEERIEKINSYQDYDLIITSYDLLKRDVEYYEDKSFKYIIADEAQYIKNSNTQNATSLKSLKGEIKFALTGTPIENSIAELWSIFDFIMPGYLYNYNKFKKKFEEPILKFEDVETLNRLKKLISPFILRRVKKDVLTELPEKNITIMKNEMESEQRKLYLSYLVQTKQEVAEELSESSFEKSKFKILMLLTRLRQICCHPSLFIENYNGSSGKLKQCLDLVVDAIEAGHKILIFSSYTSMFEIIESEFKKLNISYFKLVGDTPVSKRIEMVDEFNNNEDVKVFLISLKAGGTGLNLTSADVVIHYDPWWNLSSENQATDRAYRIGQKNSVQVYKLITSDSIEEKINKMQERKAKLSTDILSTEETFINKLSKEEILDLFEQ